MVILYVTKKDIDFSGLGFYLDNKSKFDAQEYANYVGIDQDEIDLDSIKSVIDAANDLEDRESVEIKHF